MNAASVHSSHLLSGGRACSTYRLFMTPHIYLRNLPVHIAEGKAWVSFAWMTHVKRSRWWHAYKNLGLHKASSRTRIGLRAEDKDLVSFPGRLWMCTVFDLLITDVVSHRRSDMCLVQNNFKKKSWLGKMFWLSSNSLFQVVNCIVLKATMVMDEEFDNWPDAITHYCHVHVLVGTKKTRTFQTGWTRHVYSYNQLVNRTFPSFLVPNTTQTWHVGPYANGIWHSGRANTHLPLRSV